jgi:alkyldihydroxyacetonephosphate synthase
MTILREALRWNGWGRLGAGLDLGAAREEAILAELGRRLGRSLCPGLDPVELDGLALPGSRLDGRTLGRLRAACGDEWVRGSDRERIMHSIGRSLPDLLRLRSGDLPTPCDVVVYPGDEGTVAAVLRIAADADLAVIPVGGATSVVGGIEARPRPSQRGALALDTTRLDALLQLDPLSRTATVQAGIDGPALEARLRTRGYTLGHFPQSFEHSTLGGWIATRSSGQFSGRYGALEDTLVAVRVVTPAGVLRTTLAPRSAAGPDLRALVLGSEGTLGVIVEATLRVRPAPEAHDERAMLFRDFEAGAAAVRQAAQERAGVAMLRVSDAAETELFEVLRRDPGRRVDPASWVLAAAARLGYGEGRSVLVYAHEGDAAEVARGMARARALGRGHGGLPLGRRPGRSWYRDRFRTPYLRDWLLDYDVAVDTLETAVPWSRFDAAHRGILRDLRAALETRAGSGLAMAHLSHSYTDGASLYFTLVYPLDPAGSLKQWSEIKREATESVLAHGGTLSHHHGIGLDHAPWMAREKGTVGLEALRALRQRVDPAGLMNPGKLECPARDGR